MSTQQLLQLDGLPLRTKLVLPDWVEQGFVTGVAKSINRILTTRMGERVMLPEFGSLLYLLRDRHFNGEYRVLATRFVYEAILRWEPRVRFKQLGFDVDATTGKQTLILELDPND